MTNRRCEVPLATSQRLRRASYARSLLSAAVAYYCSFGFMKNAIGAVGLAALVAFIVWMVWFVGILFEFQYPYTFTLMRVQNATSVSGVPASKVIKADGADWSRGLRWHTCSYCAHLCGDQPELISVHLEVPDKSAFYYFAYCFQNHTLVPMNDCTPAHFPTLVPTGDQLEALCQLDGTKSTYYVGGGEIMLPRKWFRAATRAEPDRAANPNQPTASQTNRLSAAAGSGR